MSARLTAGQWNRTLLQRQHLLERVDEDAIEVIDRCVGLPAGDSGSPVQALFARIDGFDPDELDSLLTAREVVEMVLHRGAVFVMDGLDARWIRQAVQPAVTASRRAASLPPGVDRAQILAVATGLLTGHRAGVPGAVVRAELSRTWPQIPVRTLLEVVETGSPLVRIRPPGQRPDDRQAGDQQPGYGLLDEWIGAGEPAVTGAEAHRDLIRMYLRGFGPSSAAAVTRWCGLAGTARLLEAMEAEWELARLVGPDGQELYDLDGLPIADAELAAPVRFLAPGDEIFSGADRGRVRDRQGRRADCAAGPAPGGVLVDGRLAGTWRLRDGAVDLTETVDLQPRERAEVEREAARLADFCAR
ncbi:hypothetical protein GOHSU_23_00020 [Gordonia hirsuta DSM 44140 = NBRC 16056]|uniref:Winged helix DNA-binding domain-containing protein n=1 Tax=Gordonia hirsuta DSM 44140 = NBRC 16056 TaxID=1121927 RepID=L7LA79_9ACTN|nr:winged helix DNA-binding domain-containing protein [Gordonia hirsuta]GAC57656.1 hypothetical protein GOHSU_23_00020 [Gordonia hirsuta DSM 44140 = NBRC 16056]